MEIFHGEILLEAKPSKIFSLFSPSTWVVIFNFFFKVYKYNNYITYQQDCWGYKIQNPPRFFPYFPPQNGWKYLFFFLKFIYIITT